MHHAERENTLNAFVSSTSSMHITCKQKDIITEIDLKI